MNGNKFFLDTNAVLYILNGDKALADLLFEESLFISIISEMELLAYKNITEKERQIVKRFLEDFVVVNINEAVKEKAIDIKIHTNLKLPDSIIAATAIVLNMPIVTSDKHFKKVDQLNLLFYEK